MKRNFCILFFSLILSSCLNKVKVEIPKDAVTSHTPLIWNLSGLTILPGEEVPFQTTNGVGPYTTDPNGIGTFDSLTLVYKAPENQVATNHSIGLVDAKGNTGTNSFKISAFQPGSAIKFPLAFGSQNYATGATITADGNMYISSTIDDSPGWERWVVFKSTDAGNTWSEVDQYAPYEEGEAHTMAITSKNNDIYTCGYVWGGAAYASEWIVRKSSNAGATWTIVDAYHPTPDYDHECYDIYVDPATGHLFTSGYVYDAIGRHAIIRESADDGATWTTIHSVLNTNFITVKTSPNGTLWAMADTGVLYKGTYSLGAWNWTTAGTLIDGPDSNAFYELRGRLLILDDNTALFSYTKIPTRWVINKTTDGGATWTNTYSGVANSKGREIIEASNGDLLAVGAASFAFTILRSTDAGATWSSVYSNAAPSKTGQILVKASDNSLIAFGDMVNSPYQIVSVRSTDDGATWSARPNVYWFSNLYTDMTDFEVDSNGTMWATTWLYYTDDTFTRPWSVVKSTDNGVTWTNVDFFTTPSTHYTADTIAFGPSNAIYVSGRKNGNEAVLRKSTDNGATWSQVDSHIPAGSNSIGKTATAVLPNGDVFYGTVGYAVGSSSGELHRGTANGTVWSLVQTFPIQAGSTQFAIADLTAFPDGSLWLLGIERDAALKYQTVAYVSTDSGVTFTEKYRGLATGGANPQIGKSPNGDLYLAADNNILKSTDNGNTWSNFYLGATLGNARKFDFDSNGKIYIMTYDQIITRNQFNNNFFVTLDYSTLTNYYQRKLMAIKPCGSLATVCAVGTYSKSIVGTYYTLLPLTVP